MMRMTSSMLACASSRPSTVCFRCRALASRNCVRRRMTVHAVPDELFQHLLERQHPRLAVDQGQEDDRERVLQRRELVELVEHHFRVGVALQLERPAGPAPSDRSRCGCSEMPLIRSSLTSSRIRCSTRSRVCWYGISLNDDPVAVLAVLLRSAPGRGR